MTLNEAIKHEEEIVKEEQYEYQKCVATHNMEGVMNCRKYAEEHRQLAEWLRELKRLKEQEPCEDIKEYYKDIWDCDINHPKYEDTVGEIVEKSYISGYVHGVENTAKEFRLKLEQKPCDNEDIAKAFQFGLAFGFGEKYDEMDKVIDEIQKMQELEQAEIQKAYELGKTPQSKIGKWVLRDGYWRCSKCREKALLKFDNFGIRTPVYIPVKSNFCPSCGLKMEVEK